MGIPYTYFIKWSTLNLWYYGVRYAKNCDPSDLFKTYFTSSKYVKSIIKEYGNPDIIHIRKTFSDEYSAKIWETKVLHRMDVLHRIDSINKNDNLNPPLMRGKLNPMYGKSVSMERRRKVSAKLKGTATYLLPDGTYKRFPIDHELVLSGQVIHVAKNRIRTKEHKLKYSKSKIGSLNPMFGINPHNTGKEWNASIKLKISESVKNAPRLTCPHCSKTMDPSNAKKYHFDKCKLIKI